MLFSSHERAKALYNLVLRCPKYFCSLFIKMFEYSKQMCHNVFHSLRTQSRRINHDQIIFFDMVLESFEKNYMKWSCFAHLVTFWKVTKFLKLQDNVVPDF
jgi:hypothetical protein